MNIFTEAECSSKGGVASGSCASGFGVCCVCKLLFPFFLAYFLAFAVSVSSFSPLFCLLFGVCCVCELLFPSFFANYVDHLTRGIGSLQSFTNCHFSHIVDMRGHGDREQHVSRY